MVSNPNPERLRDVLRQHEYNGREVERPHYREVEFCICGWRSTFAEREHVDHVAAVVLAALELQEERVVLNEYAAANGAPREIQSRLVSPWVGVQNSEDQK